MYSYDLQLLCPLFLDITLKYLSLSIFAIKTKVLLPFGSYTFSPPFFSCSRFVPYFSLGRCFGFTRYEMETPLELASLRAASYEIYGNEKFIDSISAIFNRVVSELRLEFKQSLPVNRSQLFDRRNDLQHSCQQLFSSSCRFNHIYIYCPNVRPFKRLHTNLPRSLQTKITWIECNKQQNFLYFL